MTGQDKIPDNRNKRIRARFERQFMLFNRFSPRTAGVLTWLRSPALLVVRLPIAVLLILGGFLAILPVFGLWMIPLGILLLAVDFPALQAPVSAALIRTRRRFQRWLKLRRRSKRGH